MTDSLYDLTANTLEGAPQPLSAYRGKVALVVNTASQCGFTPQYAGLQSLHEALRDQGFVVLGFPSNDFGQQEPGSAEEIRAFCQRRYGVDFPLFEKGVTQGPGQSAVFAFLTAHHPAPRWNFFKYLVGKDGGVRGVFSSQVAPDAEPLRAAIAAALAE
jgi:glutathione peroxidase